MKLEDINNVEDLLGLLSISKKDLFKVLNDIRSHKAYTTFKIRKSKGGFREIDAPKIPLKILQKKLNIVLQKSYGEREGVHGFVLNRSILSNAKPHINKKVVLNLDIKDFFPSINFGRCYGLLINKPYNLSKIVAQLICQLICYKNILPQGAPSSPIVSNMICAKLDSRLDKFCNKLDLEYTRYADDLTFSTDKDWIEQEYIDKIKGLINEEGFKLNLEKLRIQRVFNRQEVTGITVNKKLNVSRLYIRNVRAILHSWETKGLMTATETYFSKKNKKKTASVDEFKQALLGRIEFIGQVRGRNERIYLNFLRRYLLLNEGA